MVNGKPRHIVREFSGAGSNTLPGEQGRQILNRERRAQAHSLALLNGDLLSLRNRVSDISRRSNVVLRETSSWRPAQRTLECHCFAAQIEEPSNTPLELRFNELRGKVQQRDQYVVIFHRLS